MADEIKVLITGDFYAGGRINQLIETGSYDNIFNDFLPVIQDSDLSITNLESALTLSSDAISKTGPAIKASPKTIEALKFAGFNLLTLANNHIMDYGEKGLSDTLELCRSNDIDFTGAGMNIREASKVFFKQIKNKTLAFVNLAENEWSTTQGDKPGANPLDLVDNYNAIKLATLSADYVFVIVHGGHEMYQLPSPRMKKTYRFFVDAGASAVIGHHTHCYSGYEIYNGSPIFYSLGNFVFDNTAYRNKNWNSGLAVQFTLADKLNFDILPYNQNNSLPGIFQLSEEERIRFDKEISNLNSLIADDIALNLRFNEFCNEVAYSYNSFLEPYSNRYLHALRNRNLFPTLLSKRKRMLYLNLIKCESHKDVITNLLSK